MSELADAAAPRPAQAGEDANSSLGRSASQGGRYGLISTIVAQAVTTATTIVLANFLTPGEFGLVAASMVVLGLFALITAFGFASSIIRRASAGPSELTSLLWASLVLNSGVALAAWPLADSAASLMGTPDAAPYLSILLLTLPIGAISAASRALLLRRLNFRLVYALDMASAGIYGILAVTFVTAFEMGVMGVVIGRLVSVASVALLSSLLAPIGLLRRPRLAVIRSELGFSTTFFLSQGATYASKNIDNFAVARMAGAEALGLYYVAYLIPTLIRQRMNFLVTDVLYPILSRIGDDDARLRSAYGRVLRVLAAVTLPILIGLALVAPEVIRVFFGAHWDAAIPPMAIVSVAAAVESVTQAGTAVFLARGKAHLALWVNAIRLVSLALALVAAVWVGELYLVAVAVLISTIIAGIGVQVLLSREVNFGLRRTMAAIGPPVSWTFGMVAVLMAVRLGLHGASDVVRLCSMVPAGVMAYVCMGLLLFRSRARQAVAEAMQVFGGSKGRGRA